MDETSTTLSISNPRKAAEQLQADPPKDAAMTPLLPGRKIMQVQGPVKKNYNAADMTEVEIQVHEFRTKRVRLCPECVTCRQDGAGNNCKHTLCECNSYSHGLRNPVGAHYECPECGIMNVLPHWCKNKKCPRHRLGNGKR